MNKAQMESNFIYNRGVIILLCFLLSFKLFASKVKLENKKDINLHIPSLDEDICWAKNENAVFYISQKGVNKKKRKINLKKIEIESGATATYELKMPKGMDIETIPFSFAVSADHLMLNDDFLGKILQYKKVDSGYKFEKFVNIGSNLRFRSVYHLNNELFLFYEIYAGVEPNVPFTSFALYNAAKGEIQKLIHPEINCMAYSYFQNSIVSFSNNRIAIADFCLYKIDFYDFDLNHIDSIFYEDKESSFSTQMLPFDTDPKKVHPKNSIVQILEYQKKVDRIESIYFINDSILMAIFHERSGKTKIDLWNTNRTTSPYIRAIQLESEDVSPQQLPLDLSKLNNPIFKNNNLSAISSDPYLPSQKMSYDNFKTDKNLYYEKNEPEYHFQQFSISFTE